MLARTRNILVKPMISLIIPMEYLPPAHSRRPTIDAARHPEFAAFESHRYDGQARAEVTQGTASHLKINPIPFLFVSNNRGNE